MAFPFAYGLTRQNLWGQGFRTSLTENRSFIFWLTTLILILFGILLAGSVAGYGLFLIGLAMVLFASVKKFPPLKFSLGILAAIAVVLALEVFVFKTYTKLELELYLSDAPRSRLSIFQTSKSLTTTFGFWGGGPGSFSDIYYLVEDRKTLDNRYINQAHNDILQVRLEYGILGALLLFGFLLRYLKSFYHFCLGKFSEKALMQFAVIALILPFIHSFVDYPLRTISIMSVTVFLVAVITRYELEYI